MVTLLAAALLLAAAEAAHPASVFVDQWHQALRSGAKDAVLAGLAPDAIIFESGGAEMSRDEYTHHHLGSDMEFAGATATTVQSRNVVEAGNAVAVLSRTITSGTFRGEPVSSRGVETMLLERSGATWRIRHIHWSSAREHATPPVERK